MRFWQRRRSARSVSPVQSSSDLESTFSGEVDCGVGICGKSDIVRVSARVPLGMSADWREREAEGKGEAEAEGFVAGH